MAKKISSLPKEKLIEVFMQQYNPAQSSSPQRLSQ